MVAVFYLQKGIDAVKEFFYKHQFFKEIEKLGSPDGGR
jgi:hypothetical protein